MLFNFNAPEVFRIAVEIEKNGKTFYEKAQGLLEDIGVKKLFEELARDEVEHGKEFSAMLAQLPPETASPAVWDPDNSLDQYIKMMADQHVFVSGESLDANLAKVKGLRDALQLAIEFEKDSVIFFLSMQDATDDKKAQELISLLVKEEQEHLRRLSLELRRMGN